jgi:hypothetical protein
VVGLYGDELKDRAILTGFRTIEEVQYIRSEFPACKVVYVDASERSRFERHLRRGRPEDIKTFNDFRDFDRQQWSFGLLPVAQDLADIKIENEGTMKDFQAQITALLEGEYGTTPGVSDLKRSARMLKNTRVFRCLRALEGLTGPVSCPEIASLTDRDVPNSNTELVERISPRHVNWVLKDVPDLARRVDAKGDRVRYQILPAGRSYLVAIRSMKD